MVSVPGLQKMQSAGFSPCSSERGFMFDHMHRISKRCSQSGVILRERAGKSNKYDTEGIYYTGDVNGIFKEAAYAAT
jgi:hypothetical protein